LKPRILFLVQSDLESLRLKGVDSLILERDERGFFERVVTVHPFAMADRTLALNPTHVVVEFGVGRLLAPGLARWARAGVLPLALLGVLARLIRLARVERIDLIRATDPYVMGVLAWALSRATGRPFCVSLHADYAKNFAINPKRGFSKWLRTLSAWCPDFVLPRADMVLPISEYLARPLLAEGVRAEKVRIIPHGVELDPDIGLAASDLDGRLSTADGKALVSVVARMSTETYVFDVLEVARNLSRRRDDFRVVIVGSGPEEDRVRGQIAADEDLRRAVVLLGFQPRALGLALRQRSRAAMCLLGGFSLLEACAARCPVVAYDVEWHGEVVENGRSGFLVREHDIDGATRAVEHLLDQPEVARAMGERARAIVCERYSLERTIERKRESYRELLDSRTGGRAPSTGPEA